MANPVTRAWKYFVAKLNSLFNERADPKIQLEQAILEAKQQQNTLVEQASSVLANQKLSQNRLEEKVDELAKVQNNARQAVLMADEATRAGDQAKAAEFTRTAETFASRLIAMENEVAQLEQMNASAIESANRAKSAVAQNSSALQKKLTEQQQLLSKLDQAKMQESLNTAMDSLSVSVGEAVPTLDEVREKIEGRLARAQGKSELQSTSVDSRMAEVEQASMDMEARARLSEIRSQLGIGQEAQESAPTGQATGPEAQQQPGAAD